MESVVKLNLWDINDINVLKQLILIMPNFVVFVIDISLGVSEASLTDTWYWCEFEVVC